MLVQTSGHWPSRHHLKNEEGLAFLLRFFFGSQVQETPLGAYFVSDPEMGVFNTCYYYQDFTDEAWMLREDK